MNKTVGILVISVMLLAGCGEEKPRRDHIPLLRDRLFQLQEAVKYRNRAAIDSLLSVRIVSKGQGSDSLLSFVYGPGDDFAFERFGGYDIAYTTDRARIDCYVMDSSSQQDRPVTVYLIYEHDMWLVTSFEGADTTADSSSQ